MPAKRGRPQRNPDADRNIRARLEDEVQAAPAQQAAPVQALVQQAAPDHQDQRPNHQNAPVLPPLRDEYQEFLRFRQADRPALYPFMNQMPYGMYAHPMPHPGYMPAPPSNQVIPAPPSGPVIQAQAATGPVQQQQGWSQGFWDFMRTLLWLAFMCFCLYGLVIGAPKMIEETISNASKLLSKTSPSAPAMPSPARGSFITHEPFMIKWDLSGATCPTEDKTGRPSQSKSWAERFLAPNIANMFYKSSVKPVPPTLPEPQAGQPLQEPPVIPAQPEPPVMPAQLAKPVIPEPPVILAQPVVQAQPEPPVIPAQPVVQAQP